MATADQNNSKWRLLSHAIERVVDSRRGVIPSGSELEKHQARLRTRLVAGEFLQRWTDRERLRHEGRLAGHLWRDGVVDWTWSYLKLDKEVFRDVAVFLPHNWDIIKETSVVGRPDREPGRPLTKGKDAELVIREILAEAPWTKSTYKLVEEIKARGVKAGDSTIGRAIARVRAGD